MTNNQLNSAEWEQLVYGYVGVYLGVVAADNFSTEPLEGRLEAAAESIYAESAAAELLEQKYPNITWLADLLEGAIDVIVKATDDEQAYSEFLTKDHVAWITVACTLAETKLSNEQCAMYKELLYVSANGAALAIDEDLEDDVAGITSKEQVFLDYLKKILTTN